MQEAFTQDIILMMPCLNCSNTSVSEIKWETLADLL
jgi:hypothetical protein